MPTATTATPSVTQRLETVVTARATSDQFHSLASDARQTDALGSPGPTRIIDLQLSSGHAASVVFHERRDFLEILAPLEPGIEVGLADLLADLDIAPDAVTWTHARINAFFLAALRITAGQDDATERALFQLKRAALITTSRSMKMRRALGLFAPHAPAKLVLAVHASRLVRVIRAYGLSEQDAEDVAQEAIARFYHSLERYRSDAEWPILETLARSAAMKRIRGHRALQSTAEKDRSREPDKPEVPNAADREAEVIRRKRLHDAIAALPTGQRQCVQLWLDGFDYEDVAEALGLSPDAVKSSLRNANSRLQDVMRHDGADQGSDSEHRT